MNCEHESFIEKNVKFNNEVKFFQGKTWEIHPNSSFTCVANCLEIFLRFSFQREFSRGRLIASIQFSAMKHKRKKTVEPLTNQKIS